MPAPHRWWRVVRKAPYVVTYVRSSERPGSPESGWQTIDGEPLDRFEFEEAPREEMVDWVRHWAKRLDQREPGPGGRLA